MYIFHRDGPVMASVLAKEHPPWIFDVLLDLQRVSRLAREAR